MSLHPLMHPLPKQLLFLLFLLPLLAWVEGPGAAQRMCRGKGWLMR